MIRLANAKQTDEQAGEVLVATKREFKIDIVWNLEDIQGSSLPPHEAKVTPFTLTARLWFDEFVVGKDPTPERWLRAVAILNDEDKSIAHVNYRNSDGTFSFQIGGEEGTVRSKIYEMLYQVLGGPDCNVGTIRTSIQTLARCLFKMVEEALAAADVRPFG